MTERELQILERLGRSGSVGVSALATALGVSEVTVRKDLDALERKGLLTRQHGCAVPVSPDDIHYRMIFRYEEKLRIARRAAALAAPGETVMIESGSTCALLAQTLAESGRGVTILTNSAFIAGHIRRIPGARVTLFGGVYDPGAQVMTGPLVRVCAQLFHVEKFFVGVDGYEPGAGFSNVDLERAEAVRAMAGRAARTIVLTDSEKFSRRSVAPLLAEDEVSCVVTDAIPDACRASLARHGVEILLA